MRTQFTETKDFLKSLLEARLRVFSQPGLKTHYDTPIPEPGSIEATVLLIETAEGYAADGGVLALSRLVAAAQGKEWKR